MSSEENGVPKVHPLTRAVESEDPMELVANPVQGDPEVMLQCIVQEFAWMGWDAEQLLQLFYSPEYPVLNQLLAHYGAEQIQRSIASLLAETGVFRFQAYVDEKPEIDEDEEPELIELSLEKLNRRPSV
jgi:hypothetical protein